MKGSDHITTERIGSGELTGVLPSRTTIHGAGNHVISGKELRLEAVYERRSRQPTLDFCLRKSRELAGINFASAPLGL